MCHAVLQDPVFFHFLTRIDEQLAAATRLGGCRFCAGPLHVANYPRKPRGCPAAVRAEYSRRLSFTCDRCDRRATAPSVRFAGRRVYLAVVLLLVAPPGSAAAQALCGRLRIAAVTLTRWRRWWRETLPATAFWRSVRDRFVPPVALDELPHRERWARLRFAIIGPLLAAPAPRSASSTVHHRA